MPLAIIFAQLQQENVPRRLLRDNSDPLSCPESVFVSNYRISKEAFVLILEDIKPHMRTARSSSVPLVIKLASTLRFLAVGSFQRVIAKDSDIRIERTTFCKVLWSIVGVLERTICPKLIKLHQTEEEVRISKSHFYLKHKLPGVIGCIHGTHIRINKPSQNESLYFNRKGYFSINAMIICDHNMTIKCVDATKPGASHDSFIWNLSSPRSYFLAKYHGGDRSWLLGDSGYPLEPFLLTPYRSPQHNSAQHRFNTNHSAARNIVERVIGVLKSRFRCLQGTLLYTPFKCSKLINVCCAIHNICRAYNISDEEFIETFDKTFDDTENVEDEDTPSAQALSIRDSIARNMSG